MKPFPRALAAVILLVAIGAFASDQTPTVAWDNEYFSLHMLEPDYQPMMGFPLAYTAGTKEKVVCPAVIASDTLRSEDLMKNAVVEAAFVYHAAMADERIPRKPLK